MQRFKDQINIVGHLKLQRLWNLLVLRCSYSFSRWMKRPLVWGQPFSLSIEPTTACNLGCPECAWVNVFDAQNSPINFTYQGLEQSTHFGWA
jgi:hypothetical protein